MRRAKVDPLARNRTALAAAGKVLGAGGIVAFPTETVYGLCVNAADKEAVARLHLAKGRDSKKASALLVPDRAAAERLSGPFPPLAVRLADAFWPGPVTLVVPARRRGKTLGFRCPSDPVARQLSTLMPFPLLQTSANPSGEAAARNAVAIATTLAGKVDLVLDGGTTAGGRSSTVVLCGRQRIAIAREGAVPTRKVLAAASRLVLLACTGNICRSPLAETMLRTLVARRLGCRLSHLPHHGWRFASFGTMGLKGRDASEHSVACAVELGFELKGHAARPFSIRLLESAHRVYALDGTHMDFLRPYFHKRPEDLTLLDPKGREISDPYGKSLGAYRKAADAILSACEARAEELAPDPDPASA